MTKNEMGVLNLLGVAWDEFVKLPEIHPADRNEFMLHIHQAQNIVLARGTLRAMANAKRVDPRPSWYQEGT
jgi:hypothetical protein